uniref:Uncharacterized protein n=1 Tax=Rhizophora mucronata TaxID=61149 RepID=A0A2P2PMM9_RHIMU
MWPSDPWLAQWYNRFECSEGYFQTVIL